MNGIDHLNRPSPAAAGELAARPHHVVADAEQTAPAPTDAARLVFKDRLSLAEQYAQLLISDGIDHGLLGPREVPRIWDRHLVNSALVADLVPQGARVVDVGSGAGLPGLAMAIRRPDLRVDALEPMQRRVRFLDAAIETLGLRGTVSAVRGRAESSETIKLLGGADWITARAVARLDRLVEWCAPLLAPHGTLLALKGESAEAELSKCATALGRHGLRGTVRQLSAGSGSEPTWVVSIRRHATTRSETRSVRT